MYVFQSLFSFGDIGKKEGQVIVGWKIMIWEDWIYWNLMKPWSFMASACSFVGPTLGPGNLPRSQEEVAKQLAWSGLRIEIGFQVKTYFGRDVEIVGNMTMEGDQFGHVFMHFTVLISDDQVATAIHQHSFGSIAKVQWSGKYGSSDTSWQFLLGGSADLVSG